MGHFIPLTHIAEELSERGHECYVITQNYGKHLEKMIQDTGC